MLAAFPADTVFGPPWSIAHRGACQSRLAAASPFGPSCRFHADLERAQTLVLLLHAARKLSCQPFAATISSSRPLTTP